jgi:energy-coupling factor transporter ATP-binding protein EcfA2
VAKTEQATPPLIAGFSIRKLYGRYSYTCRVESLADEAADSRLLLLYGENGSGKTTLLKLLWHLLSPAENRNHRQYIAQVAFEQFTVDLTTGHKIIVQRDEGQLLGSYSIEVRRRGRRTLQSRYTTDEELELRRDPDQTSDAIKRRNAQMHSEHRDYMLDADEWLTLTADPYVSFLERDLNLRPYFLGDDRIIHSDDIRPRRRRPGPAVRAVDDENDIDLAISRASDSIRRGFFGATTSGTQNANSVYLDVITNLSRASAPALSEVNISQLLLDLQEITEDFSKYELMPRIEGKKFVTLLEKMPPDRRDAAASVLLPYLSSTSSRVVALREVYTLVDRFVNRMNRFLRNKRVVFDPRRGIRVMVPEEKTPLPPTSLSSGERQLMLLMCNTIVARDNARVFLIDEPEISLNVKWQRGLLNALLEITEGTGLQFIVATHSIEMMAPHRSKLVQLESID